MDKIQNFINKHSDGLSGDDELELRVGTFSGKYFNSKITDEDFVRIKNMLTEPEFEEFNDTYFHKFPYRQRKFIGKSSVWTKKQKTDVLDLPELDARLSLAKEFNSTFKELIRSFNINNPSNYFSPENVSILRKKKKYTQKIQGWSAELMRVENFKFVNNKWILIETIHEFELELCSKKVNSIFYLIGLFCKRNEYYSLTGKTFFIGNQPKTLERKDVYMISKNYTVTDKVDGDRGFLLCNPGSVCVLNKNLEIRHKYEADAKGILLDGEFVSKTNTFLAFDILYFEGKQVTDKILEERHALLDVALNQINHKNIIAKKFFYSEKPKTYISFVEHTDNIFKKSKELWESRGKYHLDGLIFTPMLENYNKLSNTFKWKEHVSIDVCVKFEKGVAEMYGINRGVLEKINENTNTDNLIDGKIFEFNKKDSKWNMERIRDDKQYPNAILTIKSAMLAIKENITIGDISNITSETTGIQYNTTGKELIKRDSEVDVNYRKYHNKIKNFLIQHKPGKFLLDLGAGKGGDIMKWEQAGYSHVLAIDSSWQHIYGPNGFIERYNKIKDKINVKVTIVWGDVSKNIRNGVAGLDNKNKKTLAQFFKQWNRLKFDKITCNFAIHYFLKSKDIWDSFIRNVKLLLTKGGLFVGCYVDANKVENSKYFKGDVLIYTIKDTTKSDYTKYWEKENTVKIKTMQWDHFIQENLVYPSFLNGLLNDVKLFKNSDVPENFEDYKHLLKRDLSKDEKLLSFMHKTFAFAKN